MITGFEDWTDYLSDKEKEIAKLLAEGMNQTTKNKKATNAEWCSNFKRVYGIEIGEVRFRKLIGYLRITGMVENICSDQDGYWISDNPEDVKKTIISLNERLKHQAAPIRGLVQQYKKLKESKGAPSNPSVKELF